MSNKGRLIIISGPSGVGKGTIIQNCLNQNEDVYFSISATTRNKRGNEKDGVEYHFINKESFEELIENDMLLEYAQYASDYYGTLKTPALEALEQGKTVILDIEVEGAFQVKKKLPEAVMVFILPPNLEELEKRLRNRKTDTEEKIQKRLQRAKYELSLKDKYDYQILNDTVENATSKLNKIIRGE